jgi:cytoskeleton protein RodZ
MSLEALERSDLTRLPGGIFTRAFIRAYAHEVGLDPDRTIQDFLAELPADAATATARPVGVEDGEGLEADRKAVSTAIRLILVSIPIVALVIYFSTHRTLPAPVMHAPAGEGAPTGESTPAPAAESTQPSATTPDAGTVPTPAAATSSGLTMEISPKASCWVSVTVDGEPIFSGLMSPGEKRQVSAREEVLVTVGDAGAFTYSLNGRPGKPLGAPGEVVSKRINLSNFKDLITP